MTVAFWRAGLSGLAITIFLLLTRGPKSMLSFSLPALLFAGCYAINTILYVVALSLTSVAATVFLLASIVASSKLQQRKERSKRGKIAATSKEHQHQETTKHGQRASGKAASTSSSAFYLPSSSSSEFCLPSNSSSASLSYLRMRARRPRSTILSCVFCSHFARSVESHMSVLCRLRSSVTSWAARRLSISSMGRRPGMVDGAGASWEVLAEGFGREFRARRRIGSGLRVRET